MRKGLRDLVPVLDGGFARLRTRAGEIVAGRKFADRSTVIGVKGWVHAVLRERGKIVRGSRREGHNIWTTTGREYSALKMSLSAPNTPFRSDNMAYIGVGVGSQPEEAQVTSLVSPVAYSGGLFLAPLDIAPTFPLTPVRTTVAYHRTFAETEITIGAGAVDITELGLFTDGGPLGGYAPNTRDTSLANAASQAPNAYKTIEPIGKTSSLELEVTWEIRF